ncbi:MAG: alpha/beta fold hydrolase [Intestinibacter sp.]|uniref:alpha/beta fold hydrolase n=1 Tax=Intestinibacter sp. TaxID=1965304 RepID=UPI002A8285F6|nr:alpha/beta fold hydrolase [Intestinibacter sp.]MDY4575711.1 alpha/beta fold hydrolase [Intestinibacter sp.]
MRNILKKVVVFTITASFVFNSGLSQIVSYAQTSEMYQTAKSIISDFGINTTNLQNIADIARAEVDSTTDLTFEDFSYTEENGSVTITGYTGSDKTIVIPSEIDGKKVVAIGDFAFQFTSLEGVTIPDTVVTIGNGAFYYCRFTDITIPDTVVTIGNRAFYYCTKLTNVTISQNATSIGEYAFSDCTALTKITIPDSVTDIGGYAFSNCTALTEVTLSNNLKSLENGLFNKCSKLYKVNIPQKISYIGKNTFYNCSALAIQIDIPDTVTSIGEYAFYKCSKLPSVTMSDNVDSIGKSAFYYCTSLKSLNLSKGLTTIEDSTFCRCAFSKIEIPDGVTAIGREAFANCENLTYFSIPNKVESIGQYAFGSSKIDSITIPKSVKSIGRTAFGYCSKLVNITVDDENEYYSSIDGVVFSKDLSTLVMYPAGKKDNVIQDDLTTVDYVVPDNVTTIGEYAFSDSYIQTIILPYGLKNIEEGAFYYCSLTSVAIPYTVTNIGKRAFGHCSFLAKMSLPSQITAIEDYTFEYCEKLTEIIIPNNVTTIGKNAFYCRSTLTRKAVIPDSVTSIDNEAFFPYGTFYKDYLNIYGYTGSYAETYAKGHLVNFESIEEGYYGTYLEFQQPKYTENINSNSKICLAFKSDKIAPTDITYEVGDSSILSIENTECTNKIIDEYNTSIVLSLKLGENTGTTTITATTSDGKTATCTIIVKDPDKVEPSDQDKDPIIILPGIMGSRLFSSSTVFDEDTLVWNPDPSLGGVAFLSNKLLKGVYVKPPENQQNLNALDKDDKLFAFSKYKREYGALYTYKKLIDSLCSSTDRPVYIFNYNWMKSNSYNATELRKFINTLGADKVDILAHSMGGLVASSYYSQYKDDNKVDRIITCATPYEGAPCIINKIQNWDVLTEKVDVKNAKFWQDNALGFLGGLTKSTKSSIISTSEVIPTKNYISKTPMRKNGLIDETYDLLSDEEYADVCEEIFSDLYSSAVQFQESILSSEGYNNLLDYENAYFLIGKNQPTITSIEFDLIGNDVNKIWYEDDLEYDMKGDGTVPYLSASMMEKVNGLYNYRYKFLDISHDQTVKNEEAINWIMQKLEITTAASTLSDEQTESETPEGSKYIVLRAACPVDVDVELNGEALNSSASECTSETSFGRMDIIGQNDEIKMFCLEENKDYKITLDGTDEGTMDYAIRYFNEDGELEEERSIEGVEVTADTIITTGSDKSKDTVLKIDKDGDGVVDEEKVISSNQNSDATVTFDPDNGDSVVEKTVGKEDVLDYTPEEPTKSGYTFVGWYKDIDDITTEYKSGQTYTENVTYTAKWAHVDMLGAQVKAVVDSKSGIRFGTQIYNDGDEIVEKGTLIIPARLIPEGEALTLNTSGIARSVGKVNYEVNEEKNYVTYLGTIINIPEAQFDTEMTASSYVIYKDKAGNEYTVYSPYKNTSTTVNKLLGK